MAEDRVCPHCGSPLSTGAVSCPFCGAAAPGPGSERPARRERAGADGRGAHAAPRVAADAGAGSARAAEPGAASGNATADGPGPDPAPVPAPADVPGPASEPASAVDASVAGPARKPGTAPERNRLKLALSAKPAAEGSGAQEDAPVPDPARRRTLKIAGIALAAVLVAAFGVFAVVSWMGDRQLAEEAAAVAANPGKDGAGTGGSADDESAVVDGGEGGGFAVESPDAVFWSDGAAVRARADGASAPRRLSKDAATCLNYRDGALYYLADAAGSGELRVVTNADAAAGSKGGSKAKPKVKTLYEGDGTELGNLIVRNGVAFFTETAADGAVSVRAIDLVSDAADADSPGDGSRALELGTAAKGDTWLFFTPSADMLFWLVSADGGWTLKQGVVRDADDLAGFSFSEARTGTEAVDQAALSGTTLCLSAQGSDGARKTTGQAADGGFTEYAELSGATQLVSDGGRVAALRGQGAVAYVNVDTGFSYDATDAVDKALPASGEAPREIALSGDRLYVLGDEGSLVRVDLTKDPPKAKALVEGDESAR